MLITRESDYALRVLRALSDGKQRSVVEICAIEGTPRQFMYKIIKKLEKYGWIKIARGVEGGCRLCIELDKVNLYELVCAIDNDRFVTACISKDYKCSYKALDHECCSIHNKLCEIQRNIEKQMKACSIADMLV
ncbi:MAG: RrF2 family transcriptional regulator [Filifactoraceae bacterium]